MKADFFYLIFLENIESDFGPNLMKPIRNDSKLGRFGLITRSILISSNLIEVNQLGSFVGLVKNQCKLPTPTHFQLSFFCCAVLTWCLMVAFPFICHSSVLLL